MSRRLYSPHQKLPGTGRALARELGGVDVRLERDTARWLRTTGRAQRRIRRRVALEALYQQRIYQRLIARPRLASAVQRQVPDSFRRAVRANIRAGTLLNRLVAPAGPPVRKLHVRRPPAPGVLLAVYRRAERRFGIPWEVLAALNFVESHFGRDLGPSTAGARGPMQFLPATWETYGGGGDIMDARDSIFAAARYLKASGAPQRIRAALYAYNRSYDYVNAILIYTGEITRDTRNFYSYYFWQVFVATRSGVVQITGPGATN